MFPLFLREIIIPPAKRILTAVAREDLQLRQGRSVLIIAPHPDDDVLACGALIARTKSSGGEVHVVFVTDGRRSVTSSMITPTQLADLRQQEARNALKRVGCSNNHCTFLAVPDGTASTCVPKVASLLAKIIQEQNPSEIYSPFGMDYHPDHQAVASAVAICRENGWAQCPVFEYFIWLSLRAVAFLLTSPLHLLRLVKVDGRQFEDQKKAAILEHRSQIENLTGEESWTTLSKSMIESFLVRYELFYLHPPSATRTTTMVACDYD